ncbi:hypothetical protein ABW21_db0200344 [Orbilia brochopaga]|nr:hypothetical protein ABW21_db0200344 [Drechslerella brochopaga]
MTVSSKHPTIILEELDNILTEVHCANSRLEVQFTLHEHQQEFRKIAGQLNTFHLVTSHATCNGDGARALYKYAVQEAGAARFTPHKLNDRVGFMLIGYVRITGYHFQDLTAVLAISLLEWSECDYTINLGRSSRELLIIPQKRLQRRAATSTETDDITWRVPSISTPQNVAREAEPTIKSFAFDKTAIDRQIIPITNSSLEQLLSPAPKEFQLNCKNCTIRGNVDILSGVFRVQDRGIKIFEAIDDLADSYVQLVTDDIFAHIELETIWQGIGINIPLAAIDLAFLYIPVAKLQIPGIAEIGVDFTAKLLFEISAQQDLQFQYGFQISVPNNSTAVANLGNITQSHVTGFGDTQFTTLPFEFQADNLTFSLSASLQPHFEVTIDIGNKLLGAGVTAGIDVNIPKYSMQFSPLHGPIDENCTEVIDRQPSEAEIRLGNVGLITNIKPSYEIGATFGLTITPLKASATVASWVPFATTLQAPTACLAHVSGSGLVEVTALAASISSDLALEASISSELARESSISLALAAASKTASGGAMSATANGTASTMGSSSRNHGARVRQYPFGSRDSAGAVQVLVVLLCLITVTAVQVF